MNAVGVDANTASAPLLARVSGIGTGLAQNIVAYRDANGPFRSRRAFKDVPRLGPKAFEQCAGFLRIPGGDDPLDASGVHPEAYPVVRRIVDAAKVDIKGLIGNGTVLRGLSPKSFVDDTFGLPTVTDILRELEKPGRDPRPAFKAAVFMEGVETLDDLKPGMVLEGTVTNVAAFGAFVDIGVHQDGLVHVSAMSKTFVKDPRDVVKPGDIVRVKVLEVDLARKRISLTLRLDDEAGPRADRAGPAAPRSAPPSRGPSRSPAPPRREESGGGALADALRRAGLGKAKVALRARVVRDSASPACRARPGDPDHVAQPCLLSGMAGSSPAMTLPRKRDGPVHRVGQVQDGRSASAMTVSPSSFSSTIRCAPDRASSSTRVPAWVTTTSCERVAAWAIRRPSGASRSG